MSELLFFILGGAITFLYCFLTTMSDIESMSVSEFKSLKRHLKGEPSFMERQINNAREYYR